MEISVDVLMRIGDISRGLGRWERKKLKTKKVPKIQKVMKSENPNPSLFPPVSTGKFLVTEVRTSASFEDGPSIPVLHGPFASIEESRQVASDIFEDLRFGNEFPGFCLADSDEEGFNPDHRCLMGEDHRVDIFVQPMTFIRTEAIN
jgi:hypothetical protein